LSGKTVDRIISLGLLANETAKGIGREAAGIATAGINITNIDLDRGVVLGSDQTVGGGANANKR
jgi:hypothetical protein